MYCWTLQDIFHYVTSAVVWTFKINGLVPLIGWWRNDFDVLIINKIKISVYFSVKSFGEVPFTIDLPRTTVIFSNLNSFLLSRPVYCFPSSSSLFYLVINVRYNIHFLNVLQMTLTAWSRDQRDRKYITCMFIILAVMLDFFCLQGKCAFSAILWWHL